MIALTPEIVAIVRRALEEDIGDGDVTTLHTVAAELGMDGRFVARASGVLAGLDVAALAFSLLDPRCVVTRLVADGAGVTPGQTLATVRGPARALLSGERTALNLLQRMSGIATAARAYTAAIAAAGGKAKILDTRKTVPGLRTLDKAAFATGGGTNHRIGLYDMVLIKNNHIAACGGSITQAVARVRAGDSRHLPIEVETRNFDELREALTLNVDRVMLDNMSPAQIGEAVKLTNGRVPLEASGNVTLDSVGAIAATGVDFISTGSVTHSVKALDISLWLSDPAPLRG
ncbi:MAG: carboxylating nicotinate-nucleotide diphosphorylase [Thermoflexales bacterium]